MDPDTGGARRLTGDAADTPQAGGVRPAVQPATFIAALDAHRAALRGAHPLAVFVIRLDRFQNVCETIGLERAHRLREHIETRVGNVAAPLVAQWLGPADLGAACVLPQDGDTAAIGASIAAALGRPFQIDGYELFLSCSIGSALDHPETATERNLQLAFDAMLQVYRRGGDGIGNAATPASPRLASLISALPDALARGEFGLQLQPRAMFGTGDVSGYTVRLRWQHALFGRVAPQDFLPVAESLGMMHQMGAWLLQTMLPLMRATEAVAPVQFTLLASSAQLHGNETLDLLRRSVEAFDIPNGRLCIEVPADIVPDDPMTSRKAAMLRASGVRIALGDFTNTPAAMRALELLRPDAVTLDARHVGHATRADDPEPLRTACALARQAGAVVCAKGVETRGQLQMVRDWGCDGMQGYLLAQPFPAHWLAQTHGAIAARARQLLGSG
ncbi:MULTISPECIES: EAL domain-containing protein [Cupriavidus]|uniref:GGDEF domain-containing protein n=1 Tax=Cupriavidus pauculus TaxID=82633 RepID=A0A5P2HDN1_9BURK|nr:EAL domain-containing protein [Cupriavidus pauculus]QET06301.1 GGDEF domain-containing protein [Cupriavidus pauculus]